MKEMKDSGFFISVEGFDGAGKTTVVKELKKIIGNLLGTDIVVTTSEPKGNNFFCELDLLADKYRLDSTSKALSFIAARHYHLLKNIYPHLKLNQIVITDRFMGSTNAYQGAFVSDWRYFWRLQKKILFRKPDIEFFLRVSYKNARLRVMERDGVSSEVVGLDFYQKITNIYHMMSQQKTCWIINADQNFELVMSEIWKKLIKNIFLKNIILSFFNYAYGATRLAGIVCDPYTIGVDPWFNVSNWRCF